MAAVLCQSIGSCCSGMGRCLSCPFQVCGDCCSSCCSSIGRVLTSPFTPYLLTTVVLNLPPFVWGTRTAIDVFHYNSSCQNSRWLYINAALSLVHLIAAFYIVHRIQEENNQAEAAAAIAGSDPEASTTNDYQKMEGRGDETATTANGGGTGWKTIASTLFPVPAKAAQVAHTTLHGEGQGEANSVQRLKQVFCYDIGVALYILAIMFWFVWQSVGISQILFAENENDSYICENSEKRTILSILCGFLYIMLVCVTFACSFICLK